MNFLKKNLRRDLIWVWLDRSLNLSSWEEAESRSSIIYRSSSRPARLHSFVSIIIGIGIIKTRFHNIVLAGLVRGTLPHGPVFNFVCVCVCTCVHVHMNIVPVSDPLGIGLIGGCEQPDMGTRNQTLVLCKVSTHS